MVQRVEVTSLPNRDTIAAGWRGFGEREKVVIKARDHDNALP